MSKKKSEKAPIMTGYLSKQGGFIRNWKKRYFVLTSGTLEYYEDQHAYDSQQAPKGSVSIIGANVQSFATSDHGKPYAFGVTPPLPTSPTPAKQKSRQYILVADDEPARIDWLIALTAISEGRIPQAPSTSTTTTSTSESIPDSGRTSPTSYLHSHSLREGYLLKQGGVVKNWKRRYFVLSQRARQLAYYKEKDETTLTKIIDLTGARIAREPESERMNVFSITPQTNGGNDKLISNISSLFSEKTNIRKFLIQASSSVEMNAWLEALQSVCAAEPVKRKSVKATATSSTPSSTSAATATSSTASTSSSTSTSTTTSTAPSTSTTNGTTKSPSASPASSPIIDPEPIKKHKKSNISSSKPPLPKSSSATEGEDRPLSSGDLSGHVWRFYGTDVDDPEQSNKWKQRWCILLRESQLLKYWRHSSDVQSAPGSSLDLLRASIVAEPNITCSKSSHVLSITTRGARGQIKHKTYFAFSTPERLEKWLTALQQAAVPDTDEYKDKVVANPSPIEAKLLSALQHNVERFMEFRARSVEFFKGHLTPKEYLIVYVRMFGEEQAIAMFDDVLSVLPDPEKRTELSRLFATRSSWLSSESAAAVAAAEAAKVATSVASSLESESDSDEDTTEERVQARLASMEMDENKQKQEAKDKEVIQNTLSSHITSWSHNAITGKPHSLLVLLSTLDDVWTNAQKGEFVPDSSDFVELKRTYLRVLHIIHPDKHTNADMETRVRAEHIFRALSTAFEKEVKKQPSTSGKTSVG